MLIQILLFNKNPAIIVNKITGTTKRKCKCRSDQALRFMHPCLHNSYTPLLPFLAEFSRKRRCSFKSNFVCIVLRPFMANRRATNRCSTSRPTSNLCHDTDISVFKIRWALRHSNNTLMVTGGHSVSCLASNKQQKQRKENVWGCLVCFPTIVFWAVYFCFIWNSPIHLRFSWRRKILSQSGRYLKPFCQFFSHGCVYFSLSFCIVIFYPNNIHSESHWHINCYYIQRNANVSEAGIAMPWK
jgi:hypothetical protein